MSDGSGGQKPKWDPFKTYALTEAERDLIDRRAKRAMRTKAEYQRQVLKPNRPLVIQNAAVARLVAYNIIEPITVRGTKYANMMQFLLASPIFIFTAWEVYYRKKHHMAINKGELTWEERVHHVGAT